MVILPDSRSKHTDAEYEEWLKNALSSISAPLVLFLGNFAGGAARVRELRGELPLLIIEVNDTWALPRAAELRAEYEGPQLAFEKALGEAGQTHPFYRPAPELYAIWNGKVDMLANVSASNPFCSRFFLWADAGSFRSGAVPGWPQPARVEAAFAVRPRGMLFSFIEYLGGDGWPELLALAGSASYADIAESYQRLWLSGRDTAPFRLQGGFLGGSAAAVEAFAALYHAHLARAIARGDYIAQDQLNFTILFAASLSTSSARRGEHAAIRAMPGCGDLWFYYIAFFAPEGGGCRIAKTTLLTVPEHAASAG